MKKPAGAASAGGFSEAYCFLPIVLVPPRPPAFVVVLRFAVDARLVDARALVGVDRLFVDARALVDFDPAGRPGDRFAPVLARAAMSSFPSVRASREMRRAELTHKCGKRLAANA
jgi:hypothetical protein